MIARPVLKVQSCAQVALGGLQAGVAQAHLHLVDCSAHRRLNMHSGLSITPLALPFCHLALTAPKPPPASYPDKLKTLGDHLRKRQLDLGLLQRQVAKRLGVTKETIYDWETNRKSPQIRFMPGIIQFLGYLPYDPQTETFGERIVWHRRILGFTQRDLAHRLGVDPTTLSRWERNKGKPSRRHRMGLNALLADDANSRTPKR